MITYEEAKITALELEPNVDTCTETEDAYLFYRKDAPPQDGGGGACVIMKEQGQAISMSTYYSDKTYYGEEIIEIREFEV